MISHSSEIPTPVDVLSQSTAMVPRSQWNNCTLQAQWCMPQPTAAYRTYNRETYKHTNRHTDTNSRHQSCKNTNIRSKLSKRNMVLPCNKCKYSAAALIPVGSCITKMSASSNWHPHHKGKVPPSSVLGPNFMKFIHSFWVILSTTGTHKQSL